MREVSLQCSIEALTSESADRSRPTYLSSTVRECSKALRDNFHRFSSLPGLDLIHFASIGESTRLRRNSLSSIGNKIGTADTLTGCEVVYEIAFGVRAGHHNNPLRRH